ncbi:MAG: ERF family protein [Actinomycetia bacterium]|nr:ERF family protein [Actinomycetes bacterium]
MSGPQPELAAALVGFQAEAPTINKGRTALIPTKSGGSYSYKYADLSDIWDAIRPPLAAHGLAVTQSLTGGSSGYMGIRTTVWHTSGQHISDTVELAINARTPQEVGSQVTYFKRYALSALLGLSTEDDDDGAAASRKPAEPARTELDDALDELDDAVAALGLETGQVAGEFYSQHKKPPRQTSAETVRGFISGLHDRHGDR